MNPVKGLTVSTVTVSYSRYKICRLTLANGRGFRAIRWPQIDTTHDRRCFVSYICIFIIFIFIIHVYILICDVAAVLRAVIPEAMATRRRMTSREGAMVT